jgi:hypothetical protein
VIMLTIIGGERQRGPAMVRQLGGCLATVRAAFGKASALRTCAKACSTSLIAPRPTNCSKQWQKLKFGGYIGFGGFLTCGQKFTLYAALYIGVFR